MVMLDVMILPPPNIDVHGSVDSAGRRFDNFPGNLIACTDLHGCLHQCATISYLTASANAPASISAIMSRKYAIWSRSMSRPLGANLCHSENKIQSPEPAILHS